MCLSQDSTASLEVLQAQLDFSAGALASPPRVLCTEERFTCTVTGLSRSSGLGEVLSRVDPLRFSALWGKHHSLAGLSRNLGGGGVPEAPTSPAKKCRWYKGSLMLHWNAKIAKIVQVRGMGSRGSPELLRSVRLEKGQPKFPLAAEVLWEWRSGALRSC